MGAAFTALTLDVISGYAYDSCYDCLGQEDFAPAWKRLMTGLLEAAPITKNFPILLQILTSLPDALAAKLNPDLAVFAQAKKSITRQARDIVEEWEMGRLKLKPSTDTKAKTIFHGLLQADLPLEEKTVDRLSDEAFVLIVAGAETTSKVLTVILVNLIQNKGLYRRLQAELSTLQDQAAFNSRQLESLPLFKAVVQEGLRISCPVTNRPILIAPFEELKTDGYIIPRGTPISMGIGSVLFDDAIFPEPKCFDPDRWIRAAEAGERLERYLTTFSKGTRQCVGMNLSYAELYLGIAALVSRFDMDLYDFVPERDLDTVRDCFVAMPSKASKGVRVTLHKR